MSKLLSQGSFEYGVTKPIPDQELPLWSGCNPETVQVLWYYGFGMAAVNCLTNQVMAYP